VKKKKQPFISKEEYEKRINNTFLQSINKKPTWEERQKLLEEYKANQKGR
jgi:hypothetical protein